MHHIEARLARQVKYHEVAVEDAFVRQGTKAFYEAAISSGNCFSCRGAVLEERILPNRRGPIRYCAEVTAELPVLLSSVKTQGLEGLVV